MEGVSESLLILDKSIFWENVPTQIRTEDFTIKYFIKHWMDLFEFIYFFLWMPPFWHFIFDL